MMPYKLMSLYLYFHERFLVFKVLRSSFHLHQSKGENKTDLGKCATRLLRLALAACNLGGLDKLLLVLG